MLREYRGLPTAVYVLCAGNFVNKAGTMMVPFLTLYIQDALGLQIETATRAMSVFGLGAVVASLAGGVLADRLGRRKVMLLSLTGSAAVLMFYGELTTPVGIYLATFGFAVVADMYRPAASAMLADLVDDDRRTPAYGLLYFTTNLGFCIGPLVGGVLAQRSFVYLFWGDALTTLAFALIILLAIRETAPAVAGPGADTPQAGDGRAELQPELAELSSLQAARHILGDRTFMLFSLATLLAAAVYMQIMSSMPLYLRRFGIGPDLYGLLIAINAAMVVALQLPATALAARFPRGIVVAVGAVLTAAGFGALGLASTLWQFGLCVVIFTLGELVAMPVTQAIVGELAPPELRGRYMGVLSLSFSLAMVLGPLVGGMALARYGAGAWGLCLSTGLVAAALYLLQWRQLSGVAGRS